MPVGRRAMRVVITGASAGIGRATAIEFARRGARVALLARGAAGLADTQRDVERAGGEALAVPTDVADPGQVESAAARVEQAWGGIDIWINNAMVSEFAPVEEMPEADFRRITEVTYLGAVWGTQAALRRMRPRNEGVIIQVGSGLAYRSIPLQSAYCGAKSALRAFTDSLRCELLHDGSRVRVCFLVLSAFNTPQFDWARSAIARRPRPLGRIYEPELAARVIAWIATHPRRDFVIGWSALVARLVQAVAPGLADRWLARRGWEGQFTDEPMPAGRRDNLYAPVDTRPGSHGRFGREAHATSWQARLARHRGLVALSAALVAASIVAGRHHRR